MKGSCVCQPKTHPSQNKNRSERFCECGGWGKVDVVSLRGVGYSGLGCVLSPFHKIAERKSGKKAEKQNAF